MVDWIMIFRNHAESASLLTQKIVEEGIDLSKSTLVYIDPDDKDYCQLIADGLKKELVFFPKIIENISEYSNTKYFIIADSGNTRGSEYVEFTDHIHRLFPISEIIFAIPVIPQSEEEILKSNCDILLTLFIEQYFFSIDQFYISQQ